MDPLRIILALIGAAVVAGLVFFEIRKRRTAKKYGQSFKRTEPVMSINGEEVVETDISYTSSPADEEAHSEIVMLSVKAPAGENFNGEELIRAAEDVGLHYGAWNIFHYHANDAKGDIKPVFSMANIVEPGFFDLSTITRMRTPGITLFMQLPGPMAAMDAFDEMLTAGSTLAERLGGVLQDEKHNELTPVAIEDLKERILQFNLSMHTH